MPCQSTFVQFLLALLPGSFVGLPTFEFGLRPAFIPVARTSAAAASELGCQVYLVKEESGSVRLSVRNASEAERAVERYADRRGLLRIDVHSPSGKWAPAKLANSRLIEMPVDRQSTDWVVLGDGDEVSWDLNFNKTSTLRRGDLVRLIWAPSHSPVPPSLKKRGFKFPVKQFVLETRVK